STLLAAMIVHRNKNRNDHNLTIEAQKELIHSHDSYIITQRVVEQDKKNLDVAHKNCQCQTPDEIMIGEVRTQETMEQAITFAETGHLCLATLHANNANQALERVIHFFPPERHNQIWMDLSLNLRAIVAQQLIPTPDGRSRRAVVEV